MSLFDAYLKRFREKHGESCSLSFHGHVHVEDWRVGVQIRHEDDRGRTSRALRWRENGEAFLRDDWHHNESGPEAIRLFDMRTHLNLLPNRISDL